MQQTVTDSNRRLFHDFKAGKSSFLRGGDERREAQGTPQRLTVWGDDQGRHTKVVALIMAHTMVPLPVSECLIVVSADQLCDLVLW